MSAITQAELSVLDFIRDHVGCALFDRLMPAVTFLGDGGAVWIALTAALLIFRRSRRYGAMLALSLMMGAFVCNAVLKPLVARARPFEAGGFSGLLIAAPEDFSFPSGHTTAAFAAAAVFLLAGIRGRWAVLVLAALISFSRLYLYVHYPTDVLAGVLLGFLAGYFSCRVVGGIGGSGGIDSGIGNIGSAGGIDSGIGSIGSADGAGGTDSISGIGNIGSAGGIGGAGDTDVSCGGNRIGAGAESGCRRGKCPESAGKAPGKNTGKKVPGHKPGQKQMRR